MKCNPTYPLLAALFALLLFSCKKDDAASGEPLLLRSQQNFNSTGEMWRQFEFLYEDGRPVKILSYEDEDNIAGHHFLFHYGPSGRLDSIEWEAITPDYLGYQHYELRYDSLGRFSAYVMEGRPLRASPQVTSAGVLAILYDAFSDIVAAVDTVYAYGMTPQMSITEWQFNAEGNAAMERKFVYTGDNELLIDRCGEVAYDDRRSPYPDLFVRMLLDGRLSENNWITLDEEDCAGGRAELYSREIEYNSSGYPVRVRSFFEGEYTGETVFEYY
ncbi:MAG: hypothetical protein KDD06_08680 [Phaeodactylibacter sp.]|nr:hypothetical protein [Phaeodactylibacter sp.]